MKVEYFGQRWRKEVQKHKTRWLRSVPPVTGHHTPSSTFWHFHSLNALSYRPDLVNLHWNGRRHYSADAIDYKNNKNNYLKPDIPWGEERCRTSLQWPLQLSTAKSEINYLIHQRKRKDNDNVSQKKGTYSWVCDEEVISDNLHLLSNLLSHLSIVNPVILVKWVLNRDNWVFTNKWLVHILQAISRYLLGAIIVLQQAKY